MNELLLINCSSNLVQAFLDLGCIVESLHVRDREINVPAKLAELEFDPDVIIQQESLGKRVLLRGLHELDCIKVFWSIDTHMNLYWHGHYGDLFDCVLTTQKKYVPKLKKICGAVVKWVPWMANTPAVTGRFEVLPHTRREFDMTFVGRVTDQRRSRGWFINFLKLNYKVNLVEGLTYPEMMDIYGKTCIVPNEALFGEVNFRLFEAAACGCAVVTPNVSDELEELFEVGREIEVYNDALELKENLDRLWQKPALSGAMGLAAYERVLKDHLPRSRAESILKIVKDINKRRVGAGRAELKLCLSEFLLGEGGDPHVNWDVLLKRLLSLVKSEERDAALLRIFARSEQKYLFMEMVRPYLENRLCSTDCYFNMTASLCALKLDMWEVAKHFWYAYRIDDSHESIAKPEDNVHLLLLWGDSALKCGIDIRPGVAFDEIKGIPSCASDCYFAALHLNPSDNDIYRRLDSLFRGVTGAEPNRLGFLSHLSLHFPDDWRVSAEVGITSLKVFRLQEGLTELANARESAVRAGKERFFKRKMEMEVPSYLNYLN
jgi:hypothetical protein